MDLELERDNKDTVKIYFQYRWNVIRELLGKISFKSVLDVGCGSGFLLKELKTDGCECYGLDIRNIQNTVRKDVLLRNIHFIRADGRSLPFKEDSFDLVTAMEVIEHMPKPHKFLSEARRVLKDGKYLLIGTPNFWRFSSIIGRLNMKYSCPTPKMSLEHLRDTDITEYLAEGHEKEYTPKELKNMVEKAKFQVMAIEYTPFNCNIPPFSWFDLPKLYKIFDKATNIRLLKPFTKVHQYLLAVKV